MSAETERRRDSPEVIAVHYATTTAPAHELYHRYQTYGEPDVPVEMAFFFWVIRVGGEVVLVDTGFAPDGGVRRGRQIVIEPLAALRALGIEPPDVSAVVLTHAHYDHIGNVREFLAAELFMAQTELDFWRSAAAQHQVFAALVEESELRHLVQAGEEGRLRLIHDRTEIRPGVVAHILGGHTPGQLAVTVEGETGSVVLASDAAHFYRELELRRPFSALADVEGMYAGYERLCQLAGDSGAVVPGHDPDVMKRFCRVPGAEAFAVKLA